MIIVHTCTSDLQCSSIFTLHIFLNQYEWILSPTTGASEALITSRTTSLGPQEMGSHDDHMTPSDQSDSNPPSQGEVTWIRRSYSDSLMEALLVKEPSETTFLDHQYNGEDAGEEGESEVDGEGSKDNGGSLSETSAPIVIQVCDWGLCVNGFESRVQGLRLCRV